MYIYQLLDNETVKQVKLDNFSDLLKTITSSKNAFAFSAQDIFDDVEGDLNGLSGHIGHEQGYLIAPPIWKIRGKVCHFVAHMGWRMIYMNDETDNEYIMAVTEQVQP